MHFDAMPNDALREREAPVFAAAEDAIQALARAVRWRDLPPATLPIPPAEQAVIADDYWTARRLLEEAGLPVAAGRLLREGEPLAVAGLRFPVVAKALGLRHKSDAGGVTLGIANDAALAEAIADLRARLSPPAIVVEEEAPLPEGIELIVGCRRDPRFGSLLLVGLGGIYAEILRDTAIALGPVEPATAGEMIRGLRGAPLLLGARGRVPLDIAGAADFAASLSRLAASHPEITEIEVNPLLVLPHRVVALDARLTLQKGE
jgi:acyl-CoA synthetase (NDP forming)